MFRVYELEAKKRSFSITKIYGVFDSDGFIAGSLPQYVSNKDRKIFEKPAGMGMVEATRICEEFNNEYL